MERKKGKVVFEEYSECMHFCLMLKEAIQCSLGGKESCTIAHTRLECVSSTKHCVGIELLLGL